MENESIKFDYEEYTKLLADIDFEVFFLENALPSITKTPDIIDIKTELINMNERIYKKAKKNEEIRRQDPEYIPKTKIRRKYLDAFVPEKMKNPKFQKKVRNNIKMYVHSQAITSLFRSFFSLCDYHDKILSKYKIVQRTYMKVICLVFSSVTKKIIMEIFDDIAIDSKMHSFLTDLYNTWEKDVIVSEKNILLTYNNNLKQTDDKNNMFQISDDSLNKSLTEKEHKDKLKNDENQ